jgi:hypothetical protein
VAFRLGCVLLIFALRFFAHAAPVMPAIDALPPPSEDRIAAVADDGREALAEEPSNLDDDDDDDEVALSARPATAPPQPVAVRLSWSVRTLADKHVRGSPFRPPRSA